MFSDVADCMVDEECTDGYCVYIYNGSDVTWWQAIEKCKQEQKYLLAIYNTKMQEFVDNFLRTKGLPDAFEAWTAGQRSWDNTLQTVDGQTLPSEITQNIDATSNDGNCLYAKNFGTYTRLHLDNCDERDGNHFVVCATDVNEDACQSPDSYVNGVCYKKLFTNTTNLARADPDWFTAHNMCHNLTSVHGTLPSDYKNTTHGQILTTWEDSMWLGYSRRPWSWHRKDSEVVRMKYFNWITNSDEPTNIEMCTTIRSDGMWAIQPCNGHKSYYICQYSKLIDTTTASTVTTHAEITAVTTTAVLSTFSEAGTPTFLTSGDDVGISTAHTPDNGNSSSVTVGGVPLYTGIAGAVAIVLSIVLIICVVRKHRIRKRRQATEMTNMFDNPTSVNLRSDITSHPEQELITPYDEFHAGAHAPQSRQKDENSSTYQSSVPVRTNDHYKTDHSIYNATFDFESRTNDAAMYGTPLDDATHASVWSHEAPRGGDVYAMVDKPGKSRKERIASGDMDDIMVDNVLYSGI